MNIALWIVQALLAFAFLAAGSMKVFSSTEELLTAMTWADASAIMPLRIAGAAELLGALGLILPSLTRIAPRLTPLAAALLSVVMILGVGTHLMYGDYAGFAPALVLAGLSAFVAWGRYRARPIAPRGEVAAATTPSAAAAG